MPAKKRSLISEDSHQETTVQFKTALGRGEITWRQDRVAHFRWLRNGENAEIHTLRPNLTRAQRELIQDMQDYAEGMFIDFSQVPLDITGGTPFQQKIWTACQKIPYGEVVTYGQLAELAGSPRAARAVGTAMASNRVPIIIPCHRVIAAGNQIGGFTSPDGIRRKKKLLDMESDGSRSVKMPQTRSL